MLHALHLTSSESITPLSASGARVYGVACTTPALEQLDKLELNRAGNDQLRLDLTVHHGTVQDLSCDPDGAIRGLVRGAAGPSTRTSIAEKFAARVARPDTPPGLHPVQSIIWALFPLIRALHSGGHLAAVPTEIPATLIAHYRQDSLETLYQLVFNDPGSRRSRRSFANAILDSGQVHHQRLTAAHACQRLAPDQRADISGIMAATPSTPDRVVGTDLAIAAVDVLGARASGRYDQRLHSDRMKLVAARDETGTSTVAAYIGTIGAAARTGRFDPRGTRPTDLAHLHARAREAINAANRLTPTLSWLNGKPVPGPGPELRYRIVPRTQAAELAYAGKEMENCLSQWAPGGPYAHMLHPGDHIVLIVEPGGRHIAAGHVRRQQQLLNLLGPDNQPVPEPARARIVRGLRDAGVTVTTNLNDNEPPF